MNIARRIFTEKRAFIVPLLLAVVANLLVYTLVVYPLRVKSRGAADRAKNAVTTLRAAEQDFAAARALVTGKSRAEQELLTFYGKVLPADQLSALRLTYGPLPALARKANVKVLSRRWTPEPPKPDARVARLVVHVSLEGDYEAFRQFVYALETAPEFVVVDDVTISLEDPGKPLTFKLELSTYIRWVPLVGKRRREILLGLLLVVLGVVGYRALGGQATSPRPPAPSNQRTGAAQSRGKPAGGVAAPDVHLDALEAERPAPSESERNVFRFKPKAPPPPPVSTKPATPVVTAPAEPTVPAGPPPPPPITLKFIGVMEQPGTKVKIAILSDGQGPPMFGSEGGTVAGRYRVVKIGVESIELWYLDGRGRQTIRLTGG